MKRISIVTPCFNEVDNISIIYKQVKSVLSTIENISYEHIFIDNNSTDGTRELLRELSKLDANVKLILNSRNFGPIRSPYYGLMQANGDAVILIVADLQDPPELIRAFIDSWLDGYKIVIGVKKSTEEKGIISHIRRLYYYLITKISDVELIKNYTGYGLYDKSVIDMLRDLDVSYPYFRGLISEIGFPIKRIPYFQPLRKIGKTKYSFYNLYQVAALGITSHSLIPLRLATFSGFFVSIVSLIIALIYLILKIFYWNSFPLGIASILIAIFFFAAIQLFFIGILGEYIGSILIQSKKFPMVVELERVNF